MKKRELLFSELLRNKIKDSLNKKTSNDCLLAFLIRYRMRYAISNPDDIDIAVARGRVTLTGFITETELGKLLNCASSVNGVREVRNNLRCLY